MLLLVLASLLHLQCLKSTKPGIPSEVRKVLEHSGLNHPSFLKLLLAYRMPADSLKLKASYFMVAHMMGNYGVHMQIVDSLDSVYYFNPQDFESYEELKAAWLATEQQRGLLYFAADSFSPDIEVAQAEFMINNVDSAALYWLNKPYDSCYSFSQFCHWILPYRVANEELDFFRAFSFETFGSIANRSLSQTAQQLNEAINSRLQYDYRFNRMVNPRPIRIIDQSRRGNLLELNIYKTKVFRGLGLAACMDYIPYFADSSSNLYWTSLIYPYGAEQALFYRHQDRSKLARGRIAKVYRRTYVTDTLSLFASKTQNDHTPPFLGHYPYMDVTAQYVPTASVWLPVADSIKYAYLGVFNDASWKAVDWAKPENSRAGFHFMGIDVVYIAQCMRNKKLQPLSKPFILGEGGSMNFLVADNSELRNAYLRKTSPWEDLEPGKPYRLYYWDDTWKLIMNMDLLTESPLGIRLPSNALFLLTDNNPLVSEERIFIIDKNGEQLFY